MSRTTGYGKFVLITAVCAALGLLILGYLSTNSCLSTRLMLPSRSPCVRILFIGNSYTFVNDLPGMVAQLARSGGHSVETAMVAEGGWRLADHANSPQTLNALRSSWQYVVLQEQSQIPSVEQLRATLMYPAARSLAGQIAATGATPLLFATWAHRTGWPDRGLTSYQQMQENIDRGYGALARQLDAPLAPVGHAWQLAIREHPRIALWQADGSHPSEQGTYLAACVFYAVLFKQSPEGLSYTANLPKDTARILQTIAARVALPNQKR